ncbi:integrating conjugative element protein, partial [Klebsiella pneumoniae]|nr:integrating conjugative element protein [Klebsiella pneumoniae]
AVRVDDAGRKASGASGSNWVGGQKRGGAGQPAIRVTHDLVAAGYNMMNGLPVTSDSTVGESSCNGGACSKFGSADEAAAIAMLA